MFPQDEGGVSKVSGEEVASQVLFSEMVSDAEKLHAVAPATTISLGVIGCLVYQSSDDPSATHVTGFIGELRVASSAKDHNVSVYEVLKRADGTTNIDLSVMVEGSWAD